MIFDGFHDVVYVLGIDPGIKHTGVAVIGVHKEGKATLEQSSTILYKEFDGSYYGSMRIWSLIAEYNPTLIAIEDVFVGPNARDVLKLQAFVGELQAEFGTYPIVKCLPKKGNMIFVGRGNKVTDKDKKDAALAYFGKAINQHEASACAVAMAGWTDWLKEINQFKVV
jgi:Holliday junction resolvasome RuvABC endonuclease subunit